MDPNTIIEALRGTMDPALREAAERQLNEVRTQGWRRRRRADGRSVYGRPSPPGLDRAADGVAGGPDWSGGAGT